MVFMYQRLCSNLNEVINIWSWCIKEFDLNEVRDIWSWCIKDFVLI